MIKVSNLEWLGAHRLLVHFSDGTSGEYDFASLVNEQGPMVEPLRDTAYFRRVYLEFGAPTWPNGFDVAPDWLRRAIEASGKLSREVIA